MYCIYRGGKEDPRAPIIYLEGRFFSMERIEKELYSELHLMQSEQSEVTSDWNSIIIDVEKVDFISDECLQMFRRVKSNLKCHMKFQNQSLYVETLLKDYELVPEIINNFPSPIL